MSDDARLAAADAAARPQVAQPQARWALPAGIAGIALLGGLTFAGLYKPAVPPSATGGLPITTRAPSTSADLPPPPVLAPAVVAAPLFAAVPVAAAPAPLPAPVIMQAPPPPPVAAPRPVTPALIVDLTPVDKPADTAAAARAAGVTPERLTASETFAQRVNRSGAAETVGTDRLSSTDLVVPQGTVIAAVLETAINSDLPGLVRAVVSRDVRGFDGTKILIPRGSRLVGQYSNGVALGQSRAFVIWTRLLRSDGVSIQLGSAATDALGTAGLGGKVDNHFLRRFGAATLLSVVTAGLEYLVNTANRSSSVNVGSSGQATQLAGVALQREIDIPPTIKVAQGTPVRVFVAKDLDFSDTRANAPGRAK